MLKLIDTYPNDIEVLEILSEVYLLNDEKDKAFEIFKKLVITGPNTVYGLFTALENEHEMGWRQSTVHRIVKLLEKRESIVIYSEKTDTGRVGKVYGPTLYGLYFLALEQLIFQGTH